MSKGAPFPVQTPFADDVRDPTTGKVSRSAFFSQPIVDWFIGEQGRTNNTAQAFGSPVRLTGQSASIATTSLPLPALTTASYRLIYYARITTAGSVSSSLTVTVGWTDGGVVQSYSGAAMTGNTTTTTQNGVLLLDVDAVTSLTYATTYADGGGATAMAYKLTMRLEVVP